VVKTYTDPKSGFPNLPEWEEDGNSPLQVTGESSATYSLADTYDYILLIASPANNGFDQIQVAGDTGTNYDFVDNSDTVTTGATEWPIPQAFVRESVIIRDTFANATISVTPANSNTGQTVYGENNTISSVDQFTLKDSGGSTRDTTVKVYGLKV